MKKYMKPIMESEAFVSNEYIGACWTVTCNKCDAYEEGGDSLKAGVESANSILGQGSIYTGKLGGKDPCESYDIPNTQPSIYKDFWGWLLWEIFVDGLGMDPGTSGSVDYHPVTVEEGWKYTDHPNAS